MITPFIPLGALSIPEPLLAVLIVIGSLIVIVFGLMILAVQFYRKVEQGQALILNKLRDKVQVSFTGGIVLPIIHKAEVMDISVRAMEVERSGKNGLICEDNMRADIRVTFYVRVNKTQEDVLKVAQSVGCKRASTKETLEELFQAKFSEALKTVGKQMEFTTLFTERERFKEQIIKVIGEDLNGYRLEDAAIDYLEQTPLSSLDDSNILDAQGIRKIVDLTAREAVQTNDFRRNREKIIKAQDVEAREKILELERQQADAEARQAREIATVQAREQAEAEKVEAEERLKSESARIATDEELAVAEENKLRQIEIAAKAKERTIAVETERVERDRQLEAVERERAVAIKDMEKAKQVETEKKEVEDIIRERVMVQRTVAEEEEKIKDTREIMTAERERKRQVIEAEREAEQERVKEVVAAKAKEEAAESLFAEMVKMAEAERVKSENISEAKKVLAEGVIAEESALGLAQVKVKEGEARAIELTGKAEALAQTEKHKATAFGLEAEGESEAKAMAAKFHAEAEGINEKAAAMKEFDGVGREHEEFKLELNKAKEIELAAIDVQRKVAEYQADVLAEAMKQADIDIVGGDGKFLETFFRSISLAKSVDGFVDKSKEATKLVAGDSANIMTKLSNVLADSGISSEDVKNLSMSQMLNKLSKTENPDTAKRLEEIIGWLAEQ
ncbi:MAG: flotillin family protein [Lentisphaeria bacterium]|nr:flotillin family protein [Lentisphaeria bacterium]